MMVGTLWFVAVLIELAMSTNWKKIRRETEAELKSALCQFYMAVQNTEFYNAGYTKWLTVLQDRW